MAGEGSRFAREGFSTPKPLIEVDGIPMFVRAAASLPLHLANQIVFAVLNKHIHEFGIDRKIRDRFPNFPITVVPIESCTRGQAETVQIALSKIQATGRLLIFNADSAFESTLESQVQELPENVAGALQYFDDSNPRWSFMKVDSDGFVTETAEKRPISTNASTGLYFFRSISEYLSEFQKLKAEAGELYIAPMYNQMIKSGGKIAAFPVNRYFCFGTPDDLNRHLAGHSYSVNATKDVTG